MKEFLVKVLMETHNTVYRDILVNETHTLLQIHEIVKKSFGFNSNELASFIKDEEGWDNDTEYPLEDVMNSGKPTLDKLTVSDVFKEIGDQLTYVYDYLNEWKFYLEVIEIEFKVSSITEPKILKRFGSPPKEQERDLNGDDAQSILLNAMMDEEFSEEDEDLFKDPFDDGNMESLDDYDEYQ
tara:strand:- start:10917 stop:11465 length:549 start_codon:yes stop_codon:yes gene_type:complete